MYHVYKDLGLRAYDSYDMTVYLVSPYFDLPASNTGQAHYDLRYMPQGSRLGEGAVLMNTGFSIDQLTRGSVSAGAGRMPWILLPSAKLTWNPS